MSETIAKGQVGIDKAASGADVPMRLGGYLDLIVSELHGRYFEIARTGQLYTVGGTIGGFAGAASHVSPLTANTGTPVIGLFNPTTTKAAVILRTTFIIAAVADTAVGLPVWNVIPPPSGITAAGNVTPVNQLPGAAGSAMRGFSNSALTGSVVGVYSRHFAPASVQVAVATATAFTIMTEETAGAIIVPPLAFAGLALSAAGTTYNVSGDIEFEEIDWPLGA